VQVLGIYFHESERDKKKVNECESGEGRPHERRREKGNAGKYGSFMKWNERKRSLVDFHQSSTEFFFLSFTSFS